jgi:hypothetical protein
MAEVFDERGVTRLEDCIALAMAGKIVHADIELGKQLVREKVHPEETEEMKAEIDMYLLVGDYTFNIEGEACNVSKVYMFGSLEESLDAAKVDKSVANERLKMDYLRLRDANVTIEEKYF